MVMRHSGGQAGSSFSRAREPEDDRVEDRRTGKRVSPWAIVAVGTLVVGAAALIAFSLTRPEPPGYPPTVAAVAYEAGDGSLRLTVDASDPGSWRYVSLARGTTVRASEAWDVAVRRFNIIANGGEGFAGDGGIADVGPVGFDDVVVPDRESFQTTVAGRDSTNAAVARWYRYGFTSHLLMPLDRSYVVRSADGSHYALRILSYYCPGAVPGCITFRYRRL